MSVFLRGRGVLWDTYWVAETSPPIFTYGDVPIHQLTLVVDFGYDFLNSFDVGSMTQHVQNDVDVGARNFAIFLSVKRVETLS